MMNGDHDSDDVLGEMRAEGGFAMANYHQRSESFMSDGSESTTEISEYETDFAKQLKRQRKQVLSPKPKQEKQDFSSMLRNHRKELKTEWGGEESDAEAPTEEVHGEGLNGTVESHQPDMFGDFGGFMDSSTTGNAGTSGAESAIIPNAMMGDQEEFGDFDASPAPVSTSMDADFGNFASSTPVSNADQSTQDGNYNEDFDAFHGFDSSTPASAPVAADTQGDSNDEDFGDFGGFESSAPVSVPAAAADTQDDSNDEDFDDFGGFESSPVPVSTGPAAESEEPSIDEDFGDFGGFESSAPVSVPAAAADTQDNNNDEDFGDFGGFESSPAPVATGPAAESEEPSNYEDFGDFGGFESSAPVSVPVAVNTQDNSNDEDFGDFGGFESSAPVSVSAAAADTHDNSNDEDLGDVGGFESSPAPVGTGTSAESEGASNNEDFGGFGGFESSAPVSVPVAAETQDNSNCEDVGDPHFCESAPISTVNANQEDNDDGAVVGDFESSTPDMSEKGENELQSASTIEDPKEKNSEEVPKSEAAMRQSMIENELNNMIDEMMKSEDFEEEDEMEKESYEAIMRAAKEICYTRKYYDVSSDKIIYFPSIIKTIINMDLFEKAEQYYFEEGDEFPMEYSMGLKTIAFDRMDAEGDADGDDEEMDDDLMERLSMAVQLTETDMDELREALAAAEEEDHKEAAKESEHKEDSSIPQLGTIDEGEAVSACEATAFGGKAPSQSEEIDADPAATTHGETRDPLVFPSFLAPPTGTTLSMPFAPFRKEDDADASVQNADSHPVDQGAKLSVQEELAALKSRNVTKNLAGKLKDASGVSTPEQQQADLQNIMKTNRAPLYKKEATEALNTGTKAVSQDLAFKQKLSAQKKEDMQKKQEASKNLQSFNNALVATATMKIQGQQIGEGSDGFGSFESTGPSPSAEPAVSQEESIFRGFESSPTSAEQSADQEIDEFGGFESTNPSTETIEASAEDEDGFGSFERTEPDADEFGTFESTAPVAETEDDAAADDFGNFQNNGPASEHAADEFGTFESNSLAKETGAQAIDEFGTFESTGPPTDQDDFGTFESTAPAEAAIVDQEVDEFGSFESSGPATDSQDVDGFRSFESTGPSEEQSADEFGTFESNSPPEETTDDQAADKTGSDGDGFGNFDAAPTVATAAPATADNNEDEEFGDFGDFDEAAPAAESSPNFDVAPTIATAAPAAADNSEDEEFGDFGDFDEAAPAAESSPDFDAAPTTAAPPPATADNSEDDEFGDFGDFDEAPPAAESSPSFDAAPITATAPATSADNSEDEEFGDFGDFDEPARASESSPVKIGTQPPPAATSMMNGIFDMDRVRPVFTSLQSKYPFEKISDSSGDSSLFEGNSLEAYLKSAQGAMNEKENESGTFLFSEELLEPPTEEISPKLVIENDGRGPYHSFMAPVGGILQYSKNVDVTLRDKTSAPMAHKSQSSRKPSASTASNTTAHTPSSKASTSSNARQGATPAAPTATVVAIPSKKDASSSKSAAGDLASRIPDLSFMMQSQLALPKK